MKRPLVSAVISVYNEEASLPAFYAAMKAMADAQDMDFEFIFVDDGSRDRSFEILSDLARQDPRVKILRFSRNFGAHETTAAGMRAAAGDAAVIMGADLQDPPEVIAEFVQRWGKGDEIVWAVRSTRDDPLQRRLSARLFYALIRKIALPSYPAEGTGSFCLVDRRVIDAFNALPERNRVTFGLLVWVGFREGSVLYHRPRRHAGESKFSFARQIKSFLDTLMAFSYFPMRFISAVGVCLAFGGFLFGLSVVWQWLRGGSRVEGWASVIVSVLLLGGVQLLALGVLGEYLWRVLEEVRRRPLYIVRERVGTFTAPPGPRREEES